MKKILAIAAMALLTLAASAQKLGRVNFTELYQLAPEADAAREQINAMSNEAQETFSSMYEEYQTKLNQYQQKQAELMNPIMEKAQKAVQDLAKAQGIIAVFDTGSALYFDEAAVVDLTPAARKSLGIKDGRTLEQLQQELQAQAQAQAAQ